MAPMISGTKNPSLKTYFKHMLGIKKVTIKFTHRKIRHVLQHDLDIDTSTFSKLLIEVSVEAFVQYIQIWPEWKTLKNYSDNAYERLKIYLKSKILMLKENEKHYIEQSEDTLGYPKYVTQLPISYKKRVLPYTLGVSASDEMLKKISLQTLDRENVMLQFTKSTNQQIDLTILNILNYPFVSMEFIIPGVIKISRCNEHTFNRYVYEASDYEVPPIPEQTFIESCSKIHAKSTHPKVYAYDLLKEFALELCNTLQCCTQINNQKRAEVFLLWKEFLLDVCDTNLCGKTVCENTKVCYNIGKSVYHDDSFIEDSEAGEEYEKLLLRTYLTPLVKYSLEFCTITQMNFTPSGFNCFEFAKSKDQTLTEQFVHCMNSSISFICLCCNLKYTESYDLIEHLKSTHPIAPSVTCSKCSEEFKLQSLLVNRWKHECKNIT